MSEDDNISNARIHALLMEAWTSLEDHAVGAEERSYALKEEKIRDMVRHLGKRLNDVEFAIARSRRPDKKRPSPPAHDGDIMGYDGG